MTATLTNRGYLPTDVTAQARERGLAEPSHLTLACDDTIELIDGEATDGDPLRYAQELRSFASDDGPTLLFNVHLSESEATPVELPSSRDELPRDDEYADTLFQMSSHLPFSMRSAAEQEGYSVNLDTRGFVFNANPAALVTFLDIGTRPSNLR